MQGGERIPTIHRLTSRRRLGPKRGDTSQDGPDLLLTSRERVIHYLPGVWPGALEASQACRLRHGRRAANATGPPLLLPRRTNRTDESSKTTSRAFRAAPECCRSDHPRDEDPRAACQISQACRTDYQTSSWGVACKCSFFTRTARRQPPSSPCGSFHSVKRNSRKKSRPNSSLWVCRWFG